jgi:hypothetical protein
MGFSRQTQGFNAIISSIEAVAIPLQVQFDQLYCFDIIINNAISPSI